jgi:hypothetical protein
MRLRAVPAGFILTALLAGACSDDGETNTSPSDTTADMNDDDPRTADERAADAQAAEELNLTLRDFPAGWEAMPPDGDEDDDERVWSDLADCMGVEAAEFDQDNPKSESPSFSNADDEEVTSEVAFTATRDDAIHSIEMMQRDEMPGCYAKEIEALLRDNLLNPSEGQEVPDDLEMGKPTVNPMSFAQLGDDSLAYRVTLPLSASGIDADLYVDIVVVRVGRVGVTMTFQSVFTPFDPGQAEELLRAVVDRIPANA